MNRDAIRRILIEELSNIAPDSHPAALAGEDDLRETLDLDSMDILNFMTAIHARLKVNVPEADYRKLGTLSAAIGYIAERLPA
jgi:acyl carrier protein